MGQEIGEGGDEIIWVWGLTDMIEVWDKGASIDIGVVGGISGAREGEGNDSRFSDGERGKRGRVVLSNDREVGEYVRGGRVRRLGNMRDVIGDGTDKGMDKGIREGDRVVIV